MAGGADGSFGALSPVGPLFGNWTFHVRIDELSVGFRNLHAGDALFAEMGVRSGAGVSGGARHHVLAVHREPRGQFHQGVDLQRGRALFCDSERDVRVLRGVEDADGTRAQDRVVQGGPLCRGVCGSHAAGIPDVASDGEVLLRFDLHEVEHIVGNEPGNRERTGGRTDNHDV